MDLRKLDDPTRAAMLSEIDRDVAAGPGPTGVLYLSPRLSRQGLSDYPDLLRDAVQNGNEAALASDGRLPTHEAAKHPKGGPDIVKAVPVTAPQTMAEGEFNCYYARGVCIRALADAGPRRDRDDLPGPRVSQRPLHVSRPHRHEPIRGRAARGPRIHIGMDTALRLPPGLNSGLSVHL